jgi:hypothetical protein
VAPAPDPVEELLAAIPEAGTRAKTAKSMLAQARNLMRMRDNGFPAAYVRGTVDEVSGLPWMRDLSGPTQEAVSVILGSDELPKHIETLQRMVGGSR